MRFSKRFRDFGTWFSTQDGRTGYVKRIARIHSLYPSANLNQLRGHIRIKTPPAPLYKRAWDTLNSKEQSARDRSLGVLSHARKSNQSLTRLARERKISVRSVLRATDGFKKVGGRWMAKKTDRIPRIMKINEDGKERWIEIRDSRSASLIGKYHSAVREYLDTGNTAVLAEFKGKRVKDSSGKWHTLETNPNALKEINTRIEEPELQDIYLVSA